MNNKNVFVFLKDVLGLNFDRIVVTNEANATLSRDVVFNKRQTDPRLKHANKSWKQRSKNGKEIK